MKDCVELPAKLTDLFNWQQHADLIVGMHQTHQAFFSRCCLFFQLALEVFEIDMSIFFQRYITNRYLIAMTIVFYSVKNCMVFDGRSDDMCACKITQRSSDGRVVAFSSTAGKKYRAGFHSQDFRY